jgi:hypothetical protein
MLLLYLRRTILLCLFIFGLLGSSCMRTTTTSPGSDATHHADMAEHDGRADDSLARPDSGHDAAAAQEICNGLDDNNNSFVDEGGVCPPFCIGRTWSGHLYYFCAHLETFFDARKCCDDHGMKLARVDSAKEQEWLISEGEKLWGAPPDVWLGGTDLAEEGTWRWEDGDLFYQAGQVVLYCGWKSGEPSNGVDQHCLAICSGVGWNDIPCGWKNPHICEKY